MAKKPAKPLTAPSAQPPVEKIMSTLPASLIAALPQAAILMRHVQDIEKMLPVLTKDMALSEKKGAVALARAFVVLHRTNERIKEMQKAFSLIFEDYKIVKVPSILEQEGITNVPLAEGWRVQASATYRASIKPDQKPGAYEWLQKNGFESLITETVNASTLSSAAKSYAEDENKEFPDKWFNVALVPNTSVVQTK